MCPTNSDKSLLITTSNFFIETKIHTTSTVIGSSRSIGIINHPRNVNSAKSTETLVVSKDTAVEASIHRTLFTTARDSKTSNRAPDDLITTATTATSSTSMKSGTTKKLSTSTPTTAPLVRNDIVCHDEGDFLGHADINGGYQDKHATEFSGLRPANGNYNLYSGSPNIVLSKSDKHGVSYYYFASWLPGCVTTKTTQDFRFPLGMASSITAYLVVREDYTKCKLI